MSQNTVEITDSSFDADVLQAGKPVLVDYWAEWCGPCKMLAPILDEVAAEYGDKITVAKLCLLYTSPSPRDKRQSRMPSSA